MLGTMLLPDAAHTRPGGLTRRAICTLKKPGTALPGAMREPVDQLGVWQGVSRLITSKTDAKYSAIMSQIVDESCNWATGLLFERLAVAAVSQHAQQAARQSARVPPDLIGEQGAFMQAPRG